MSVVKNIKVSNRNVMFILPHPKFIDIHAGLILGTKHNYVIDTGFGSEHAKAILEYISDDHKPIIVINTHSHYDHIWGNWCFGKSLIISHRSCRELADKQWDSIFNEKGENKVGEVHKCLPNMTFEGSLHFPEDDIEIFHSPGHSIDSISVYDAVDKVLYAGDSIGDSNDEIVPWIDTDLETFKNLIKTYRAYDFDTCISGHNTPQGKDVLCRMETALEDSWKKQNK